MKNDGLLRFYEKDIGKSLPEICDEFNDTLFDIDNKSLTHRPDLWGHRGFARELSAIFGSKYNTPPTPLLKLRGGSEALTSSSTQKNSSGGVKPVPVVIKTKKCRRFCAVKISGVQIKPSDLEKTVRLENLDVRSISNIVDTTNLVMLEYGQPMHAFDAKKVSGKIIVRHAALGEKLLALDGIEYKLTPDDVVIADEKKVLSIAGIMGGEKSAVTEQTTEIIFESANFDPFSVRKTSLRLGLRSESSMRFEKSLDPEQCLSAIRKASEYVLGSCPEAKISSNLTDQYPQKFSKKTIKLAPELVRTRLGIKISDAKIQEKLRSLGFGVTKKAGKFVVEVPSFRATRDIEIPEDLIEEVVRLYGFEMIPSTLPTLPITPPRYNHLRSLEWHIRNFLAARGMLEVYNSSFVSPEDFNFTGETKYITVENSSSEEHKFLRKTLISNIVAHLESELRLCGQVNFFELGKVYVPPNKEALHLAIFMAETGTVTTNKFFVLKSNLLGLLDACGISKSNVTFTLQKKPAKFLHPFQTADIFIGKNKIGVLAVLHPQANPVQGTAAVFTELNVEKLLGSIRNSERKFKKLSPFPPVRRDLSIVLNHKILIADIKHETFSVAECLKGMELFDEFIDEKKLGKDLKNLAFHLEFQSHKKTLDEKDIQVQFKKIVKKLEQKFGAKLRLDFEIGRAHV